MAMCFVIQPFDGGAFDKRYDDTLKPAIEEAGIEAYRVDRDDAAVIPIASIERGIREADVCLADISTDNPNVWFEVGFAIASNKDVVLVCSNDRERFPFDVQHRTIIRYKRESIADFRELAARVTTRLQSAIRSKNEIATIRQLSPIANSEGLSEHEMVALVLIAESLDEPIASGILVRQMSSAGYTNIAASLSLRSLAKRHFISSMQLQDYGKDYLVYEVTEAGFRWLEANQNKLVMRRVREVRDQAVEPPILSDEIPF